MGPSLAIFSVGGRVGEGEGEGGSDKDFCCIHVQLIVLHKLKHSKNLSAGL